MTSRSAVWRVLRATTLLAVLAVAIAHASGLMPLRFITSIDLGLADARLRAFMPGTLDPRIVIVDIDEKSLAEIGRWPWGRDRLAALTAELFVNQHAAVVGFDMLFAEPDTSSGLATLQRLAQRSTTIAAQLEALQPELDYDARFANAMKGRRVALGYYLTNLRDARKAGALPAPAFDSHLVRSHPIAFTHWDGYSANIDTLARAASAAGFFNNVPDPDGLVRAVPLIAEVDGKFYEPLSLAMFRLFAGEPSIVPVLADQRWFAHGYDALDSIALKQGDQQQSIPVDERVQVRVPYRGPGGPRGGSFEYLSATDLINHRIPAAHLAGKLVLVGTTAPGLYDQRATPVADVYPGVEVHANSLSGLLDAQIPVKPDWSSSFEVIVLLIVATTLMLGLPRMRPMRAAQFASLVVVVLVAINLWSYRVYGLLLPIASPLILAGVMYLCITVWSYVVEGRSRRALARLFGTYVPPELVAEMSLDPERYTMRAENRELTIIL